MKTYHQIYLELTHPNPEKHFTSFICKGDKFHKFIKVLANELEEVPASIATAKQHFENKGYTVHYVTHESTFTS